MGHRGEGQLGSGVAILDRVAKEAFSQELMPSLRPKWWERGRNFQRGQLGLKWSDTQHGRREVRELSRARSWKPTSKEGHTSVATHEGWQAVAMAAVRQERWQYVGIAGSQFNSYASILPPLQFYVTGAIPCLFSGLLFQNLPFHLREGKHTH